MDESSNVDVTVVPRPGWHEIIDPTRVDTASLFTVDLTARSQSYASVDASAMHPSTAVSNGRG